MNDDTGTILTSCSTCRATVELEPDEIKLHIEPEETRSRHRHGRFAFVCPRCVTIAVRWADEHAVRVLVRRGVEVVGGPSTGTGVLGGAHPEVAADGPPLTWDDLLDLHLLLQRDDWFDQLVRLV